MIDNHSLNELADRLSAAIPDSIKTLKSDINSNIRAILESGLRQMNLVSREEFDVQCALLARTQEKLRQLQDEIEALKKQAES